MIFINKTNEPDWFKILKRNNQNLTWDDFGRNFKKEKNKLRNHLLKEQGYVCCYCGCALGMTKENGEIEQGDIPSGALGCHHNTSIEHIKPRVKFPDEQLSYYNMCISCRDICKKQYDDIDDEVTKHCDNAKADKLLNITPLDEDCLTYFSFRANGRIEASSLLSSNDDKNNAIDAIEILKLNSGDLQIQRRNLILEISKRYMESSESDFDCLLSSLKEKDQEGRFFEFYFVVLKYFSDMHNKIYY